MVQEFLRPDIYVFERDTEPTIQGIGVSAGGFIGEAQWGPDDEATLITSFTKFKEQFGEWFSGTYMAKAVRNFFLEGGSRCYIVRITSSAVAGSATIDDLDSSTGTGSVALDVDAKYKGSFGNRLRVTTEKASTTVATPGIGGSTTVNTIPLEDASEFEVGDSIVLGTVGTNKNADYGAADTLFITKIASNTITISPEFTSASGGIPTGVAVATSTTHRYQGTIKTTPAAGATQIEMLSTVDAKVGQIVVFMDTSVSSGTKHFVAEINQISDKTLILDTAIPSGLSLAADDAAASVEFDLSVELEGEVIERHKKMSIASANKEDYVNTRLSGDGNDSNYVIVQKGASSVGATAALDAEEFPQPINSTAITGGSDGTVPITSQTIYTGSSTSGLPLFNAIEEVTMISAPGKSSTIAQAVIDYCESKGDRICIFEGEAADDTVTEIVQFKESDVNRNTSFGAIYFPWIKYIDPETQVEAEFPPSGHIQGQFSETARFRGVHKAPANVSLRNITGLAYKVTDSDHAVLNPKGINAIREFPGEGIRIMGARTIQTKTDGRHYVNIRNLLNFIIRGLKKGNRFGLFEPINRDLYIKLDRVNRTFLRGIWRSGALFPSDNPDAAFFVKVDDETTTDEDRASGKVNVEIGIQPARPAEFIIFRISLFSGAVNVSEFTVS